MSKKTIVEIQIHGTNEVIRFDGERQPDQVWEVGLFIKAVDSNGNVPTYPNTYAPTIYLKRQTLEEAGLLPFSGPAKKESVPEKTSADLIIELLGTLGFYPTE